MSAVHRQRMLVLCLATVYFVWGTSYIATRVGVLNMPPLLFAGVRFILGGALLLGVAWWRGVRPRHLAGQWRHLLVLSFIGVAISNGLQSWALQWITSHASALLNASCALWIVVFGLFGARAHHPGSRAVAGLVIGFAGTALLIWPTADPAAGGSLLLPQLATLLACVVWSLGTIYMRNHSIGVDLFALIGVQMLLGGAWMALAGLALGEAPRWRWSTPGALALGFLVIFSCCFAYTAYGWLARHATPAQVGTYSYVNPVIAAAAGYLLLDERLSPLQIAGGVVILAGVLMVNWPVRGAVTPAGGPESPASR